MATPRVFVAYDFEIEGGLLSDFDFAKEALSEEIDLAWAGCEDMNRQGEVWRNMVRPELEKAQQLVAFFDLPNANVGYEFGYALGHGEGKRATLLRVCPEKPAWLDLPPLQGIFCEQVKNGPELVQRLKSPRAWFQVPARPDAGDATLLLCAPTSGANFIGPIRKKYPEWRVLAEDGWSLNDLPQRLRGVGAVVWLVMPHREGSGARDGSENAAASVVAGYAHACGMTVRVLAHEDARKVADVAANVLSFVDQKGLMAQLVLVHDDLKAAASARTAPVPAVVPRDETERPDVGQAPQLDTEILRARFIGRGRLLGDLADALRGLELRRQRQPAVGGAKVQAIWVHGFGGMGKSWFLRRATFDAAQASSGLRIALVDWDQAGWRAPLADPPQSVKELLEPIAYRLAQMYGTAALDPYWSVVRRTRIAEAEASRLRQRLRQEMHEAAQGEAGGALSQALSECSLAAKGASQRCAQDARQFERLFAAWFDAGGGSADDPDAVLRPDSLRVGALQACMRSLCSASAPLLLVLDTCEVIATDLERWLRQLVAPLCDGATPFLAIFGSRSAPDVAEPPGSREVWRSAVGEERWREVPFDEGVRFSVEEIALALARVVPRVADADGLAAKLHGITLGVPLALRSLIDMHSEGSPVFGELDAMDAADAEDGGGSQAEDRVVEVVVDRFLLHLRDRLDREADFRDIVALSLLHQADRDLLAALWRTENVKGRLRALAIRYSLLAVGDLNATVRGFLRRRWRLEDRPDLVGVVIDELWRCAQEREPPGRAGEPPYMAALATRLDVHAWHDPRGAPARFAPAIALALAFDERAALLVSLAGELRVPHGQLDPGRELRRLSKQLQTAPSSVPAWGSDAVLAWLERDERDANWAPVAKGALDLLRGLQQVRLGQHDEGNRRLSAALAQFSGWPEPPRRLAVGEAMFDIGYAQVDQRGREGQSMAAFRASAGLGYATAACANNVGVLLGRLGREDESRAQFLEAIKADPAAPRYPRNLGDMLRERKRFTEAKEWYDRALQVDAGYPAAFNGLALLHQAQGQFEDAELNFRKAMDADPKQPIYPRNLGDMLRERKRVLEAKEWYDRTMQVEAGYPAAFNGLALLHQAQGQFEDAELNFRKAMDADPKEPIYPRNLGDMLFGRGRHSEARTWYDRALRLDPERADIRNSLAWALYQADGDMQQALVLATEAVQQSPEAHNCHTLAMIQLRLAEWSAAAVSVAACVRVADAEFVSGNRQDLLDALKAMLASPAAAELQQLFLEPQLAAHWRPWAEAVAGLADQNRVLDAEALALRDALALG